MRDWKKQIADAKERFASNTDEHLMTVLNDDGLYRHIRFKAPGTGFYWFDLVTWPGYLSITGDMGAFTFARDRDMFTFFYGHDINPGYWGEKVVTGEVKAYSEDTFREWVEDEVRNAKEEKPDLDWKHIDFLIEGDVLYEGTYADGAYNAVHEFNDDRGHMGFRFYTDEGLDFIDFTHRFLWCCHAIQWGIDQYNAAKKVDQ
jgi:hypothetical protein